MRYIKVTWPEIQDYMGHPEYSTEVYFDPKANVWFIPEWMENEVNECLREQLQLIDEYVL